jgi:RNA polymerase sigma-70 factor (ECF subfamily)
MAQPEPRSDTILAQRAAEGDEAAWRAIYDATRERLFGLLVYHVGNREEALDVLQETYLHAFRGLRGFRGESSLEGWLVGIATRRALDWKRRFLTRFKRTDAIDDVGSLGEAPGVDLSQGHALRQALAQLPERQRMAVLLHEWLGFAYSEVGTKLGCSEATARVHAHRGREALREILGEQPEIGSGPAPSHHRGDVPTPRAARIREERS